MKKVEISMKEILIYILRRWKAIIGFALVSAVLVGGYAFFTTRSTPDKASVSTEDSQSTKLSISIDLVDFNNEDLNAYTEYTARNDRIIKLIDRYLLIAQAAPLDDLFEGIAGAGMSDENTDEQVTVESPSIGILSIKVKGPQGVDTERAVEALYKYLQGYTELLYESISPHKLSILLKKTETITIEATADAAPDNEASKVIKLLTSLFLGFLVGLVLGSLFSTSVYLVRLPVQTPEQVQQQLGIRYLGGVRRKKRLSLADRLAGSLRVSPDNKAMDLISANLSEFVCSHQKILVTGTIAGTLLDDVAGKLSSSLIDQGVSFVSGPDINKNAETVTELGKCDAVVLVERIDRSQLKHVNEVKERIDMSGKEILGYVLY